MDRHKKRVEEFEKKFDSADSDRDGQINEKQFHQLYQDLLEDNSIPFENASLIFKGLDISDTGKLAKSDFMQLVRAEIFQDDMTKYKIIFRAVDSSRTSSLSIDEVVSVSQLTGETISVKEVEQYLYEETGKSDGRVTFPVFFKIMTGRDANPKVDPYEGKLNPTSRCCLLI